MRHSEPPICVTWLSKAASPRRDGEDDTRGVMHQDGSVAQSSSSILSKAQGGIGELVDGCVTYK